MLTLVISGRYLLSMGFNNGFGLYIESVPPTLKATKAELGGHKVDVAIDYDAIAFKLPFLLVEVGIVKSVGLIPDISDMVKELEDKLSEETDDEY